MSTVQTPPAMRNLADLVARLGNVPLERIRILPPPGTATVQDVIDIAAKEGRLCELIDGVLVEKAMSWESSQLAIFIGILLGQFVRTNNLGIVTGADGTMEIMKDLLRIPDIAYTSWDRMPGRRRPAQPVPRLAPDLAIEVLSPSNTAAEMESKRDDYFNAGVVLVWEVDPDSRTVTVYTSPAQSQTLAIGDTLDGNPVLPGFTLLLSDLFAELDRHG